MLKMENVKFYDLLEFFFNFEIKTKSSKGPNINITLIWFVRFYIKTWSQENFFD